MDKTQILEAIKELKKTSKKRNFTQSFDLLINLKDFNLKKDSFDTFITLPNPIGKEIKICAIVSQDLQKKCKELCNKVILDNELTKFKDNKKETKNLAKTYDFFIAQSTLMGQIATVFGRVLGPLQKMPNPKLGGVLMPSTDPSPIIKKFKKLTRIATKNEPIIKVSIGNEKLEDEKIVENFFTVYDSVIHNLPKTRHNIKSVLLKLTMSKPVKIETKQKEKKNEKQSS